MKKPVFTGAGVAIITPMYEDGSINFDELGRIIEDQIARHTDADGHLALEDGLAFPAAQAATPPADWPAMGAEMAARRRPQP